PYQLVAQNELEPLLLQVAEATPGVEVKFASEVVGLEQDDDGVTVQIEAPDGPRAVRAEYLVGGDGGSSMVRKSQGIALEGRGNLITQRQATFVADDLYERIPMGKGRHYYFADKEGAVFIAQGSRRHFTLNA